MSLPRVWRAPSRPATGLSRSTLQSYRSFSCSLRLAQSQSQPQPQAHDARTTHFGFETVEESQKASRVGAVFSSVAANYDTMNDLMSLYTHRLWKDRFVRSINPGIRQSSVTSTSDRPPQAQRILDIAGGTGDIALRLLDHATLINNDHHTHVTISDINPQMLSEGRKRMTQTPYANSDRIDYLEANAEDLSAIESSSIDLYTVAFGIRNFTSISNTLREAHRVLKPGGVFACLEFSKVGNPLLNAFYKRWSFGAIPLIGQLVAGDRDSYQYLVESIERFPSQREFEMLIRQAGFIVPRDTGVEREDGGKGGGWENLMGGIACIHKGVKPIA